MDWVDWRAIVIDSGFRLMRSLLTVLWPLAFLATMACSQTPTAQPSVPTIPPGPRCYGTGNASNCVTHPDRHRYPQYLVHHRGRNRSDVTSPSDRNPRSDAIYANAGTDSNPVAHVHPHAHSRTNHDLHSDANADTYSEANSNPYPDINAHPEANSNSRTDRNANPVSYTCGMDKPPR